MTEAPSITIGTPKQIAYARDIFARQGAYIRTTRAAEAAGWRKARAFIGQAGRWGPVMTAEMADRADALAVALEGGAESHAVYWIEDLPVDALQRFVVKGVVSSQMVGMGLARKA